MKSIEGFILSRQWRDTPSGVELEFWLTTAIGAICVLVPAQSSVFFLPSCQRQQAEKLLKQFSNWKINKLALHDFSMRSVVGVYFQSERAMRDARELLLLHELTPFEADIKPCDRFLMERFIRGSAVVQIDENYIDHKRKNITSVLKQSHYQPRFKVISLDIETSMHSLELYSIAIYAHEENTIIRKVFMLSVAPVSVDVSVYPDEKSLLLSFFEWFKQYDPDIVIGWNVINFDMWFLQQLCDKYHIAFAIGRGDGRGDSRAYWRTLDDEGNRRIMSVPGRVVIDGIELLRTAAYQFESFSLSVVAGELLSEAKLVEGDNRGEAITELFQNNKTALAQYNLQDCKLVWDIFDKLQLLDFAVARTQMTGLPLERLGGSVAAFDFRYLPLLHREGFVAPNGHWVDNIEHSPGGFVMNSRPGIYDHVLVLDFKSLYPSIIRSFKIDPMGMAIGLHAELDQHDLVPGFKGAWFAKQQNILPALIAELWQLRDNAKTEQNAALSQAIKILMNSFYGVLGAAGCRFYDLRLASSITRRGHQIIQQTAQYIEDQGWPVIYGDTDSVFVWVKGVVDAEQVFDIGRKLEGSLNKWWKDKLQKEYAIDSALEIEFETHYRRFLMPTVRGSDQGSKKRYAGVVKDDEGKDRLVFKGLEFVRTDWTLLAKHFQQELYRRIFFNESYRDYVLETVQKVLQGECDTELIYRKRLRRKLEDYQRNIPPHVQAARKAVSAGTQVKRGDWIEYVMTVNGAEPVQYRSSVIDYQHYVDRQLAPVADGILCFLGDSLSSICDQQLGLF